MKTLYGLCAATSIVAGILLSGPASAATKQTIVLTEVSPTVLATGWRATNIIGAKVNNDAGESIGKVEDLIVTDNGTVPYAVLSVGGFLGMDAHHVVVSASSLELMGKKLTLHGGTKESLKALPNFTFKP